MSPIISKKKLNYDATENTKTRDIHYMRLNLTKGSKIVRNFTNNNFNFDETFNSPH